MEKDNQDLGRPIENPYLIRVEKIFENDNFFVFLFKKTEKIITAVYLLTNHLKDEDDIKWQLRNKSSCLLSDILLWFTTKEETESKKTQNSFRMVLAFLDIAQHSFMISSMNASLLRAEIVKLLELITSYGSRAGIFLGKEFFETGTLFGNLGTDLKRHEGHNITYKRREKHPDSQGEIGGSVKKDIGFGLKDRRTEILNIVRVKGEVSIKDISISIKDCSEKTIQRELISMVKDNVLNKKGERRWSRYSLPI